MKPELSFKVEKKKKSRGSSSPAEEAEERGWGMEKALGGEKKESTKA